jgi:hypothetical protein
VRDHGCQIPRYGGQHLGLYRQHQDLNRLGYFCIVAHDANAQMFAKGLLHRFFRVGNEQVLTVPAVVSEAAGEGAGHIAAADEADRLCIHGACRFADKSRVCLACDAGPREQRAARAGILASPAAGFNPAILVVRPCLFVTGCRIY